MAALTFAVSYALMGRPASDISIHATWATEGGLLDVRAYLRHNAHILWHVLVNLLVTLGLPTAVAASLITALSKGAELWLLWRLAETILDGKTKPWVPGACAVCAALVSSLCLPWYNPTVYLGAGTPNTWHSPTQLLAMAFMLACVPMTARRYADFERRLPETGEQTVTPVRQAVLLSALLALSTLAKPVFMQAFLPAACLYFLVQWIRHPRNSRFFVRMLLVALPSAALMIGEFLYYFILFPDTGMTMSVTWVKALDCLIGVLLVQGFPVFALLTDREPRKWRDPLLALTVLMDAAGLLEQLVLSETGFRAADGNMGWAMMGAALMLWAVMLPRFIGQFAAWRAAREKNGWRAARYAVGLTLVGWHLISGIYYVIYLLTGTAVL